MVGALGGTVFHLVFRGGLFSTSTSATAANPYGFAAVAALVGPSRSRRSRSCATWRGRCARRRRTTNPTISRRRRGEARPLAAAPRWVARHSRLSHGPHGCSLDRSVVRRPCRVSARSRWSKAASAFSGQNGLIAFQRWRVDVSSRARQGPYAQRSPLSFPEPGQHPETSDSMRRREVQPAAPSAFRAKVATASDIAPLSDRL